MSAWQLTGSVGIVIVAFTLLPRFLRAGIYTMPEYLEYRYNALARTIMALFTVVIYVTVTMTAVLYSGALTLSTIFDIPLGAVGAPVIELYHGARPTAPSPARVIALLDVESPAFEQQLDSALATWRHEYQDHPRLSQAELTRLALDPCPARIGG